MPFFPAFLLVALLIGCALYHHSLHEVEVENARLRLQVASVRQQVETARKELDNLEIQRGTDWRRSRFEARRQDSMPADSVMPNGMYSPGGPPLR